MELVVQRLELYSNLIVRSHSFSTLTTGDTNLLPLQLNFSLLMTYTFVVFCLNCFGRYAPSLRGSATWKTDDPRISDHTLKTTNFGKPNLGKLGVRISDESTGLLTSMTFRLRTLVFSCLCLIVYFASWKILIPGYIAFFFRPFYFHMHVFIVM